MTANRYFSAGGSWQNGVGGSVNHALATVSLNGTRADITGSKINNVNTNAVYNAFRIGADDNFGAFSGQLNEILVFENKLSTDEMDRVETYLAIKYGTTYANGTRDYKNASGTAVWTAANNAGYISNIAGIANDGALQQKQSWSTNPGQQVLISTTGLAQTNAGNGIALTAGQYLIWGDNGLAKTPTVATTAFTGLSHHFSAIWKVQNTGSVSNVRVAWPKALKNLSLIQSTDATFGAGDNVTAMTGEFNLNGVIYNYADVSLPNGSYFTFGAKIPGPGGVTTGITQWYRADEGIVSAGDGTNVTSWTDFAKGTVSAQIGTAPRPFFKTGATNYLNFNPGVNFTAIQQILGNITTQTLESTSFDIFTLTKEGMTGTRFFNIGMDNTSLNGANWDQPGLYADGNIGTRNSTGGGTGILNPGNIPFSTTTPNIVYNTFTNTTIQKAVNGGPLGAQWAVSARGLSTGGHMFGANGGVNPPGGDDWGFIGNIGEVIIYGNGNLSATDRNKVTSYLALKYGITLPVNENYVNSNGAIVWNATTNSAYHNNVAGIAADEASSFSQKQSISANKGQQVIIGTNGLADRNADNNAPLADGQFLVWGDNGGAKSLSVSVTGISGLNLRFGAIWKVQKTGSIGNVRIAWPAGIPSITLIRSNDPIIDGSDTRTPMAGNVQNINGVSYNYADVALEDGQYFTFAGYVIGPGGVASAAWYRSDAAGQQFSDAGTTVVNDGETIYQWNEYKGTGYDLLQASVGARPTFSTTNLANFNPTVTFDGSNDHMQFTPGTGVNVIDRADGTLYASGYFNVDKNTGLIGFNEDMDYPGLYFWQGGGERKVLFYSGNFNGMTTNSAKAKRFFTAASGWTNGASTAQATVAIDGNRTSHTGLPLANLHPDAREIRAGNDGSPFDGQLNEMVVFETQLSEADMDRVDTYMAIKYGNTLANGTRNYVNSSGSTVWSATVNNGFHSNIAGIGRDDEGSLNQKQSWSTNAGRQVLISTTGLENTNAANTGVLDNNQFLIWGDNGLAKSPTVAFAVGNVNYHFASIWKVQNNGNVRTVRVAWPAGYTNLKLIQSTDETIEASDLITPMTNTQLVNGIEYAYTDVVLANGTYFTFAAFIQGPGGVTSNLSHWYRADKFVTASGDATDVSLWTDFTSGVTSSQLGDSPLPKFKQGGATYFNFNPGINFTATNQKIGNITEQTLTSLEYDIFSLSKESMSSGRFFNIGVNNNLFNGNNWDHPGLHGNGDIGRRTNGATTVISGNIGGGNPDFLNNTPNIMFYNFKNTSIAKGLNGGAIGTPFLHTSNPIGAVTGGHIFGANNGDGTFGDDGGFIGNIGELIIYGAGAVSATDRVKVDSYLAIKYGITLAANSKYTTSAGTVVWDGVANTAYHNNVAGIGYDFNSALDQKQSRTQNTTNSANQITIGVGVIAETNAANINSLSNDQFLVWGDNGNVQTLANAYAPFDYAGSTTNGRRMNRIWKVQNTNNVSNEVLIRFPIAGVGETDFGTTNACADFVILFADDAAFTTNVTVQGLTVNGTNYDIAHTFPNGASYFTYAKVIPFNQGVVYLPANTETTSTSTNACDVGTWKYFRRTSDNSQKLMGITGYTNPELANLSVTITPQGTSYDNGSRKTKLMPRITTVTNSGSSPLSSGKVRIYYSLAEKNATAVPSEQSFGWFKYEGSADEITANVYATGTLDPAKTVQLTPNASGVEDGVDYVEFHNITSFSSFVYLSTTSQNPLPVTLQYFRAVKEGSIANLTWKTTAEVNNKGFEVQRSSNVRDWHTLGFVNNQTVSGNSKGELIYEFADKAPLTGVNYYRLKQIDYDDSFGFSSIAAIRFEEGTGLLFVYPNPVTGEKLSLSLPHAGTYSVSVYNVSGQEVLKSAKSNNTVDIHSLRAGVYVLQVVYENGETHSKTFIVK